MDYGYRQELFRQGVMTNSEAKLEAVLNNWVETHCSEVSWDNLIQVLTELKFIDIAQDVRRFLLKRKCEKLPPEGPILVKVTLTINWICLFGWIIY